MTFLNKHPYLSGFLIVAVGWAVAGSYIVGRVTNGPKK